MWTRHHRKTRTGRLIVPAITAVFLTYFGYHALHGDYGIYSKFRLEDRKAELEATLAQLRAQRGELEQRVRLLHDGSLEKDMLDEQARRALNVSHSDELTIMRAFMSAN